MQQTALNLDGSSRGQLAGQLIPAGVPGRPLAAPTKPINSHDPITSATPSKIPRRPSRGPSISQLFPPFRTIECVDASCWGRFFDRNVQDGSEADFPLFSDASWKLYIFWATEYIFSKQILRRIFVLWSIVIDFSSKICETKFASRSGKRNKRKKSLGEISLSKEFREKEGYPFECFARAQSFSSSGSGGGEGSVTIEEEEKIAERGGSCAPCDELISSNVAGTSWMRENWCASRFRIIARRYTARVRASREITLSAKLPRFDSVLCELHPSTSFSVCPFAWSQPCCKKSLSLWNPRVNSFAWKCSTPEERIRYLEMFINISSPIGTMQWRVFIYFLRIEAQLGRNKNIILNGLRRRCLVLLHSFVNNCVNCVNWEWFMGSASSSFLLSRCTFNDICLYDTSSLQSSDFIILGIFIKETSSTLSFPLDKIKKKYHDDYKLSFDLSPMIRLLLLNLRSPYL